jgi:hypothetical protein
MKNQTELLAALQRDVERAVQRELDAADERDRYYAQAAGVRVVPQREGLIRRLAEQRTGDEVI